MSKRALRKERKRKGLCPECGGQMDRTGWACRECTDKANERKLRWANERITNGTCPKCGQKALPGKPYCQECKNKTMERNKTYPRKTKRVYTANDLERTRRKRRERQAKGLCPECGRKMDREGWACSICTEKLRLRASGQKTGRGGVYMSDPNKEFVCPKYCSAIGDKWGRDTPCVVCLWKMFEEVTEKDYTGWFGS